MFLPKKGAAAKILEKRGSSEIPLAVPGRFEINVLSSFTGRTERAFFFARPGAADCFFSQYVDFKILCRDAEWSEYGKSI